MEKFVNNAATSLAASLDNVSTTLTVRGAAAFPTSPSFRIRIDNEYLLVTGVSGITWTVTRGVEGSTAVSHTPGAVVRSVVTAATYANFVQAAPAQTVSVAGSGTVNTDASTGVCFGITASGSFTLANPTNPVDMLGLVWRIYNSSGGNVTVTLGSAFRFGTDFAALPLIAAGKTMYLTANYNAGVSKWDVMPTVNGF